MHLRGVVEKIAVPSDEVTRLELRPLGNATLHVSTNLESGNQDTLLLASAGPLAADPGLGFMSWAGEFMQQMLVAQTNAEASRSNGYRKPPPELLPLMKQISGLSDDDVSKLINQQIPEALDEKLSNDTDMFTRMLVTVPYLKHEITLADRQKVLLTDLMAESYYTILQRDAERYAKPKDLKQ